MPCVLLIWLTGCASVAPPTPMKSTSSLDGLLPPSNWMLAWRWETEPAHFLPDDLFEYINGSADLYLSYGFRSLVTTNMVHANGLSFIIDIYDMGTLLNAFGIYSNYRYPEGNFAPIGAEAIISPGYIRFYQGRYLVDLNASDTTPMLSETVHQAALEISQRIESGRQPPPVLDLLPPRHLIEKSQKYISEGLLGYQFFPRGLEAIYKIETHQVKAFIVLGDSPAEADAAFNAFSDHIRTRGEDFKTFTTGESPSVSGVLPYHQSVIAAKSDRFVCGLIDLQNSHEGLALLKDMLQLVGLQR